MATVNLQATPRIGIGKEKARKLRQQQMIPAIIYGHETDPTPVTIGEVDFRKAMSTSAGVRAVIRLDIEGGSSQKVALVKEIQRHPVTHRVMHADLLTIDLNETVDVNVPIAGMGTPPGVKLEGGVLGWARREISIRVKPMEIPESIEIDLSDLHLNQAIHIGDVKAEGFEILDEPELTICSVASTRIVEEETAEGEEDAEAAEGAEEGEGDDARKPEGDGDAE